MFLYLTLGTNDVARAKLFYDPVMATLGHARHATYDNEVGYGPAPKAEEGRACHLWINQPYMKLPATWGNGTMVAFAAATRKMVDAFHAVALAHGGTDEGAPGLRPYGDNFYACYVRDPDGNKLSAVCERAE